jgi:hypothetical protein
LFFVKATIYIYLVKEIALYSSLARRLAAVLLLSKPILRRLALRFDNVFEAEGPRS